MKASSKHWDRIGVRHHHGICLPLSALHDKDTGGIGDFSSLYPLIDWCREVGFDVIQLLPINETANQISPYSLYSSKGLNPVYIDVRQWASGEDRKTLDSLNRMEWIDYTAVRQAKILILRKIYGKEEGFYPFLQSICIEQMKGVRDYAEKRGVLLKGDLPILVSPDSYDCKEHPELFHMNLQAGAPPDRFSKMGQNWGFPVYNYEEALPEILKWWTERLRVAEKFYHLYRIDHIVGLFRMWAIANGQGHFIPKNSEQWEMQGMILLKHFLQQSTMLPIGEDLGSVPDMVRERLLDLGIPGTKVMRWEEISADQYPECSMTTVSTHDTETLEQWWRLFPKESRSFSEQYGLRWTEVLSPEGHFEILKLSHHTASLFHINLLQEYFQLIKGLSWPERDRERINTPYKKSKYNWRYRFKPSISEFINHRELKGAIKEIIHG